MTRKNKNNKDLIRVTRITVRDNKVICIVKLSENISHYTNVQMSKQLLQIRPNLSSHVCVNGFGNTFGDVVDKTSLPHVLEHLVIDLQTDDPSTKSNELFVGNTEWISKDNGTARVEVSFADDIVALHCLCGALDILNGVVVP